MKGFHYFSVIFISQKSYFPIEKIIACINYLLPLLVPSDVLLASFLSCHKWTSHVSSSHLHGIVSFSRDATGDVELETATWSSSFIECHHFLIVFIIAAGSSLFFLMLDVFHSFNIWCHPFLQYLMSSIPSISDVFHSFNTWCLPNLQYLMSSIPSMLDVFHFFNACLTCCRFSSRHCGIAVWDHLVYIYYQVHL